MTASEPDPTVMTRLCREAVPSMLTDGCGVDTALASAIGEDVLARAVSFAALDVPDREVLMTPFIEEVFDHEPPESTLTTKAAVAVVVRTSLLEEAHTNSPRTRRYPGDHHRCLGTVVPPPRRRASRSRAAGR